MNMTVGLTFSEIDWRQGRP